MNIITFHELSSTIHDGIISTIANVVSSVTVTTTVTITDDSNNDLVSSATAPFAVKMKILLDNLLVAAHYVVAESCFVIIIMKTATFHELPSAVHDGIISTNNNAVFSATITTAFTMINASNKNSVSSATITIAVTIQILSDKLLWPRTYLIHVHL